MLNWYKKRLEEMRQPIAVIILQRLDRSGKYLGLDELIRVTGQNRGMILQGLKYLHGKGLIQSNTGKWNAIKASSGASTFGITAEGKNVLRA
ncbi:hypothetical protein KW803_01200 [Candidatus Saccharibacteria bacterium]|nr:hypothetical protein [Candidatus Saccharibacteria bacterium]